LPSASPRAREDRQPGSTSGARRRGGCKRPVAEGLTPQDKQAVAAYLTWPASARIEAWPWCGEAPRGKLAPVGQPTLAAPSGCPAVPEQHT